VRTRRECNHRKSGIGESKESKSKGSWFPVILVSSFLSIHSIAVVHVPERNKVWENLKVKVVDTIVNYKSNLEIIYHYSITFQCQRWFKFKIIRHTSTCYSKLSIEFVNTFIVRALALELLRRLSTCQRSFNPILYFITFHAVKIWTNESFLEENCTRIEFSMLFKGLQPVSFLICRVIDLIPNRSGVEAFEFQLRKKERNPKFL